MVLSREKNEFITAEIQGPVKLKLSLVVLVLRYFPPTCNRAPKKKMPRLLNDVIFSEVVSETGRAEVNWLAVIKPLK